MSITLSLDILNKIHNKNVFIETGTFDGRGVQLALDAGFERVLSVEIDDNWYLIASTRFIDAGKVELYHGDSIKLLPVMLNVIDESAVIWLDAHIQGSVIGEVAVPLLRELDIIFQHPIKNHVILIDDVRLMGTPGWWKDVTLDKVIEKLKSINPNYIIKFEDSKAAKKDILVAYEEVL